MTDAAAYLAGLIDGEGCVHLDTPGRTYRARVSVGMSAPALPLLTELQAEWGGTIYCARPATTRWASAHTWHLTGSPAARLLTAIRPHLRLKARQADLALEVERLRTLQSVRWPDGKGRKQYLWTEETRRACEEIKQQMHALNAKGPRAPAPTAEVV